MTIMVNGAIVTIVLLSSISTTASLANIGNVGVHSTTRSPQGVLNGWCKNNPTLCFAKMKYTFGSGLARMKLPRPTTIKPLLSAEIPDDLSGSTISSSKSIRNSAVDRKKFFAFSSVKRVVDTNSKTKNNFKLATFSRLSLRMLGSRVISK